MSQQKPIKALLALQGGGSAGSFTWGALDRMLDNENNKNVEAIAISGTSAGAMNGRKLKKAISEHGWTKNGRQEAKAGLKHLWTNIVSMGQLSAPKRAFDSVVTTYTTMLSSNPFNPFNDAIDAVQDLYDHTVKYGYSSAMEAYLRHTNDNPEALKSNKHVSLYANGVDDNGNEAVWTGKDLTTEAFLASAALKEHFHHVTIRGVDYHDGAYLGGANPNMQLLLDNHRKQADVMIVIMTNPPQHPVTPQLQKDLKPEDVEDTNGLILHQVWNEVAYHMHQYETGKSKIPVIVIYPNIDKPYDSKAKQRTDEAFVMGNKAMGQDAYEEAEIASDGFTRPNMTVADLQKVARRTHKHLKAA